MKKQKIGIIVIVLLIIIMGFGTTYSWLSWNSKNDTVMNITIGNLVNYEFKTSNAIKTTSLAPVLDYTDGEIIEFSLRNRETKSSTINMFLAIDKIDKELISKDFKYVLLHSDNNKDYYKLVEGDFSQASINNNFYLLLDQNVTRDKVYYKLYLYIDGSKENDLNMMNKSFSGIINMEIYREDEENGN